MAIDVRQHKKKFIVLGSVLGLLGFIGIGATQNSSQQPSSPAPTTSSYTQTQASAASKAPVIETKTETKTESIPYGIKTQNDASLESGKQVLATRGVHGEKTITYTVTYTDGKETSRSTPTEQITRTVTDEVTKVGTKIATPTACPNGTYTNSVGNIVCSPYASSSVPAGASAKCSDGTYSFSQSRRGTCSGHGGVATWY